jgi:ankyrin repeat protein
MSEPLLEVLRAGDVDRLAALLAAGADPNLRFKSRYGLSFGLTAVQVAVAELDPASEGEPAGPIDAVVLLLRHGADVNGWDESRTVTPIVTAVLIGHIEAVHILLAAGADPNVHDDEGRSPLRHCADSGLLEMARLLVQCGADKTIHEAGGSAGMNALGLAAYGLHVEMVRLLLAHGADPHVQDADHINVFDHLRHAPLPDAAAHERQREIRELLGAPESAAW